MKNKSTLRDLLAGLSYALVFLVLALGTLLVGLIPGAGVVAWGAKVLAFTFAVLAGAAFLSPPRRAL